jgi:hypothetical protein
MKNSRPDDVCVRFAAKHVKIRVSDLGDLVLFEGTKVEFQFLSELFSSMVTARDDGFQISPTGAGSALFATRSTRGLYIHRLDATSPARSRKRLAARRQKAPGANRRLAK